MPRWPKLKTVFKLKSLKLLRRSSQLAKRHEKVTVEDPLKVMDSAAPQVPPAADVVARDPALGSEAQGLPTTNTEYNEEDDIKNRLDTASKNLQRAQVNNAQYLVSTSTEAMNKAGDAAEAAKRAAESAAMKVVRDGVNTLVDTLPGLARMLADIAKAHPFIGVVVEAFQVVVELNLKRRTNDKKIGALFLQMGDMMGALLQLRTIKDSKSLDLDGTTVNLARMQDLVKRTAADITSCGNVCDTYAKKHIVIKVIQSSFWEDTLEGFIKCFAKRQEEFVFALSIHTGAGVDHANVKLDSLELKIDVLVKFFTSATTQEYSDIAAVVEKEGGPDAVRKNDKTLNQLLQHRSLSSAPAPKHAARSEGPEHDSYSEKVDVVALKHELSNNPESAIESNMAVFMSKFELQKRELAEEMRRMVHHEGDRVIQAVTSGSHDRIVDPDIHEIWKEMRWPGHVKSRHFVLALRDYFRQKAESRGATQGGDSANHIAADDRWAVEWIDVSKLQAITEAFDDDASGFITIAEVNQFTAARPKGWSLPHWLAYWAIGWQMSATYYLHKIMVLFTKMFAMQPLILPANTSAVQSYLRRVYQPVWTLTVSITCAHKPEALFQARFKDYIDAEETRLREALQTVRYDIDALDTLKLVMGPGRIEKYLYPLLYLLLKRDFDILRLCCNMVVHKDELRDSARTLQSVFNAVSLRHDELEALFEQQNLDPGQQFKAHARELFDYWHDGSNLWSLKRMRNSKFKKATYVDENEDKLAEASKILNCPPAGDNLYADVKDVMTEADARADEHVKAILGRWSGFICQKDPEAPSWPNSGMRSFCFHASAEDTSSYEATDSNAFGRMFTITGGYVKNEGGSVEYTFSDTLRGKTAHFVGTLSDDGKTLSGNWGDPEDDGMPHQFIFNSIPAGILVARPPPVEFEENRARALWKYAATAVRNEVRRKMLSWSYIKERRDIRAEYLRLSRNVTGDLTPYEVQERLSYIYRTSTHEDMRCFDALQNYRAQPVVAHSIECDACGEYIFGARLMCLKCGSTASVDFCDKPSCRDSEKTRDDLDEPHVPTHDFVKIRGTFHQFREMGKVFQTSVAGLERARNLLSASDEGTGSATAGNDPDDKEKAEDTKVVTDAGPEPEARPSDEESNVDPAPEAPPKCISCSSAISYTCWYCIECQGESDVFVCQVCEQAGEVAKGKHKATHNLVLCKEEAKAAQNTEQRLSAVEDQLSAVKDQLSSVKDQLALLSSQFDRFLQSFSVSHPS